MFEIELPPDVPDTTHGTASPDCLQNGQGWLTGQLIGSPMAVPWSVWEWMVRADFNGSLGKLQKPDPPVDRRTWVLGLQEGPLN